MGPTALESARESQAADRNDAIGQKYGPIAQRIAEAGDAAGVTDYAAVQAPRERYKNEERRQLENRRRFEDDTLAGEKLAQAERRQTESNQGFRESVANAPGAQARRDKEQSRLERWQAISMLAGGNPSRQQFAMGNALLDMSPDQRNSSLRYMLPGGDRAAAVDAANAATAGRMAQSAMSAFLTNNPMATPEQRAMFEQRAREANPAAAGAQDIAAGKPETPEGQAELGRLAESMDTGTFGVNTGDSSSMAEALMRPPYNLRRPEAEELAYRYMNRRSWFGIGRPRADGSTPPAGVGPTPNPINPRVPLAAPSRPPGV
jgi:hypothetical protein